MPRSGNRSTQAENRSRPCNAEADFLAGRRRRGDLDVSNTDDCYLTRRLALCDQDHPLWTGGRESKALERIEGQTRQVAKNVSGSQFAALTILDDLKPVR